MAGTGKAHLRREGDALLRVEDLVVEFPVGRTGLKVHAVSGISSTCCRGETLGLVGESGCGKSTTGRAIMQLPRPTRGSVSFDESGAHGDVGRHDATGPHEHPDDLPGPDLVAQPAPQGARHRDGAAEHLEGRHQATSEAQRVDQVLEDVGIDPERGRGQPAPPVLGWAVSAHLDRPRARARPEADHLRRAGVRARRQRAGAGAQPAGGSEGSATGSR